MSSPPDSPPAPAVLPATPGAGTAPENTASLEFKARLLMLFMLLLVCGSAVYVLYARGAFESTQRLVLMAEDSEGVVVGMDMTFAGFPIGRVRRIELAEDGKVRILVDVASKDARWLRTSSVFTLVRGIVGGPSIRAYTGLLNDPPLPEGAVRSVLQGDASAEIARVVSAARELIDNLASLTRSGGSVGASLASVQVLTGRPNAPGGALAVLLGSEIEAKKFSVTLDRVNRLLARFDSLAAKTDTQVFGDKGFLPETRATVMQLNAMLGEARASLKKVDAILVDAQAVSSNAKEASADLGALRAEVEASLRKVDGLVGDINRKWPFSRDAEIKLP
ncbi:MAG: MCE family protein [Polaromonas sp.]|nr:MCE family protein [Polaromonas sp.]